MEEIKFNIIEYIGKLDNAIYVLLSLNFNDNFFEGIFFYKENFVVLTVQEELEDLLGCEIEDWSGYNSLMWSIIESVQPYDQAIKTMHEFDKNTYEIIYPGAHINLKK